MVTEAGTVHTTLLDLLSNTLVLYRTAPYLSVPALSSLAATSTAFRDLVYNTPLVFRHLDLTDLASAAGPLIHPGETHRNTLRGRVIAKEGAYSDPLHVIFSKLSQIKLLKDVQTLILDGLSVTAELVREIIRDESYSVRILSIREAKDLDERKLRQVLNHAVRPSRAPNTPKLKGLYVFGPRDPAPLPKTKIFSTPKDLASPARPPFDVGSFSTFGAQIGAVWNERCQNTPFSSIQDGDAWFQPTGRMLLQTPPVPSVEWAETVRSCEGIISFDAVLCRGPRHGFPTYNDTHDPSNHPTEHSLRPAIATIALGSTGCARCHSAPEIPSIYGVSPDEQFPLLAPPPLHSSRIRAAKMPSLAAYDGEMRLLIARCEDCLRNRWCELCNKWWCEDCYAIPPNGTRRETGPVASLEGSLTGNANTSLKVYNGFCFDAMGFGWDDKTNKMGNYTTKP
ncbi:hypothetical protein FGG08_002800 [Glutinoglossum americanum]|uniref:Ubiquitin fusion degradation protein n=1 Tax=Glutinoglossum americanum TaxID=1670608 RepID=A0A9P8HZJ7_9PEZI|nr:hypothetical protein FGG08_002800 [Glutinoglossum americanum]